MFVLVGLQEAEAYLCISRGKDQITHTREEDVSFTISSRDAWTWCAFRLTFLVFLRYSTDFRLPAGWWIRPTGSVCISATRDDL